MVNRWRLSVLSDTKNSKFLKAKCPIIAKWETIHNNTTRNFIGALLHEHWLILKFRESVNSDLLFMNCVNIFISKLKTFLREKEKYYVIRLIYILHLTEHWTDLLLNIMMWVIIGVVGCDVNLFSLLLYFDTEI